MKKINLSRQIILVTISLQFLLMSCSNYYKAINTPLKNNNDKAAKVDSLKQANRTFILRSGDNAFHMSNPVSNTAQNIIECTLDTLSESNKLHLTKGRNGNMKYKKNNPADLSVLNEVHIYVNPDNAPALGKNSIPLDKVKKIEVIEKDKKRTSGSYALGGVGITLGVLAIVGIIFLAAFAASWGGGF